jgi:bacillithiol biosynthesis cysteine-adding enzyme BshC
MHLERIPLAQTQAFSPIFLDYISQDPKLVPFYHLSPTVESFASQIEQKQQSKKGVDASWRATLAEVLHQQYKGINHPPEAHIELLKDEKTFTVTTGHQLSLFTGPLYFIYKIITCIRLASALKERYPEYNFVPVYWMASEDHDFAEINHFYLFGKRYQWDTEQTGAVGHFNTNGFEDIFAQVGEIPDFFEKAYNGKHTLSEATRYMVNELFADKGLVCIDADDKTLKAAFKGTIKEDIFQYHANHQINQSSNKLDELGYKTQIFPREINFFYLEKGKRERIVAEGEHYEVLNSDIRFTKAELEELIEESPERFSPNVALRPLYQEVILPNLAYIGGPGELAYWLQLKGVFDHYEVPFPILMPRNFAMVISQNLSKKFEKLDIPFKNIFQDISVLKKQWLQKNAEVEINLSEEKQNVLDIFSKIQEKAQTVDKTLEGFVGAEYNKLLKSIENIEKRLKKSEEQKQNTEIKQLENLKEKLFPEGNLQERHDNFLNFYINQKDFIEKVGAEFEPFSFTMHLLIE